MRRVVLGFALLVVAYFVVYAHRVSMGFVGDFLGRELGVGDIDLFRGLASSAYFYAYAAAQVPTGVLLDTLGISIYGTAGLALTALGGFALAYAPDVSTVIIGRALVGFGSAAVFVGIQRFIALYLPHSLSATAVAVALIAGGLGSIFAQYPLVALSQALGVRAALALLALLIAVPALLTPLLVRDRPGIRGFRARFAKIVRGIPRIARDRHTAGVFISMFVSYGTIMLLQALVLRDHLMDLAGLGIAEASALTTLFAIGMMVGQPIVSYLSDRVLLARKPFLLATHVFMALYAPYLVTAPPSVAAAAIALFAMGLGAAGQMIAIPMAREPWPREVAATAFGFVNISPFLGAAIMQSAAPYIFRGAGSWRWNYPLVATSIAILNIVAAAAVATLTRETMGRGGRR